MFELNAEQSARKLLEHCAGYFNTIFFAQSKSFLSGFVSHARSEPAFDRPALFA
jgi:hypothetical protein